MPRFRPTLVVTALAASVAVGTPLTASAAPGNGAGGVPVQLIAMNDFHGRISPQTGGDGSLVTAPGPDGAYGTADDVSEQVGGAANVATTLGDLRQGFGGPKHNSFFVGAGDLVSASPFNSSAFKDEPTIEVLNALGLDFSAVGNHEFDRGQEELYRISGATDGQFSDDVTACEGVTPEVDGCYADSTGQPFAGAEFPYLAANVTDDATGEPVLPPYEIVQTTGNREIGLIGVVTDDTPNIVAAAGIEGLTFGDEAAAINHYAGELREQGVEAIVVMVHEGGTQGTGGGFDRCVGDMAGTPIGAINADVSAAVDVIISAHTHVPYDCTLPDPDGQPRLVTQAGFYGKALTDIQFRLGSDGDVVRSTATATNVPVRRTSPDPDVQRIVSYWEARAAEAGNVPVGTQTADLDRAHRAGSPVRDSESSLGNLVADAQLAAFPDAEVAFMNPGGLRADINCASSGPGDPAGTITYAETFAVQPFSNTVNTVQLTGAAIEQVLEQQWGTRSGSPSFLQLSVAGLTYEFDPIPASAGAADRIDPASILVDGVRLNPTATYTVVANSFLIAGGDAFPAFVSGRVPGAEVVTGPNDVDAFNAYLAAQPGPVAPPALDRAVSTDPAQAWDDDRSGAGPCTV
ncbi:bifunctional metallophosphatase/5'-nucleotidase [Geodermatophilus sp. SYSU D00691]